MAIHLENKYFTATINEKGAELVSLKSKETGLEYIWNGNPEFWGRHTPVLFPFVGRLKDDVYRVDEKEYHLGQHGFARDMIFEIIEQGEEFVTFSLIATEETLEKYPFRFELNISYQLNDTGIDTRWEVVNSDNQKIYFGIGGHPAFSVPLENGLAFEDYYFELTPAGEHTRIPFVPPFLALDKKYQENVWKIALSHELFHNDALVYETTGKNSIAIKSDKSSHSLTLSYEDIPYVGLWSPYPAQAPFVCIEPWWSHADTADVSGDFKEKPSIQTLEVGEKFNTSYMISVK